MTSVERLRALSAEEHRELISVLQGYPVWGGHMSGSMEGEALLIILRELLELKQEVRALRDER